MNDKIEKIKALPGYKSCTFDGVRWLIEFVPPSWLDGESASLNDEHFDNDYPLLLRSRKAVTENRIVKGWI